MEFIFNFFKAYFELIFERKKPLVVIIFLLMLPLFGMSDISNVMSDSEDKFEICGTVMDINGNVYETVWVAGECKIRSNLKVRNYSKGDLAKDSDHNRSDELTIGA